MPDKKRKTRKLKNLPLLAVLAALLIFPGPLSAHRVYIFAWAEGDMVYTESYFGSKKKAMGGLIEVFDLSGDKILEGKTNDKGEFSFKIPKKADLRIVLTATMGHKAEYVLKADEITEIAERSNLPMKTVEKESPPSNTVQADVEKIREMVEKALDSRLKPISRTLAKIQEEKGPGITEVVGGIGYIFGLMGIILYFRNRKKR